MVSEDDTMITYHTDGSRPQCVGNYSVQKITINGRYRSLPALLINNKCRISLSDIKETRLCVPSIVSGVPMKDILKRISCQMRFLFFAYI